jgi:hypothetical protein
MAGMESDLSKEFEWAAVIHRNTEHPHVHVVLRGIATGGRSGAVPAPARVCPARHSRPRGGSRYRATRVPDQPRHAGR